MGEFMEAALARTRAEVPEPRETPNGTWRLKALKAQFKPGKDDGNDYIMVVLQPVDPQDDVDPNELEGFEPDAARIFHRHWMADNRDEWNFWELAGKFGIKTSGRPLADLLPEFEKGYEIMATAEQKIMPDGERIIVNLSKFSKV